MTCVVGETDGTTIYLAADSAGGFGDEMYTIDLPKIFEREGLLFGYCGSYRIGQLLRYRLELPPAPARGAVEPFLVRELVPALRQVVIDEGAAGPERMILGEKTSVVIGCAGEIWCVSRDLTVTPWSPVVAIGSGRHHAYGALYALRLAGVGPVRRRLKLALEAAAQFTPSVRGPWCFLTGS